MSVGIPRPSEAAAEPAGPARTAFWLLLCALFVDKILFHAVSGEMFFDGVIYADVARNLAEGIGSVWRLKLAEQWAPLFSEHPPLQIWLQALIFRAVGDSVYVEHFYGVATALATGFTIVAIYRLLARGEPASKSLGWLPLVILLIGTGVPSVPSNNLMENTLGMFTTAAVYLALRACEADIMSGSAPKLVLLIGAGLAITAAVLTKGPVGLFPIAAIGLRWIALGSPGFWRAIADTLVLVLVATCMFALLWLWPEPRAYMQRYIDVQVLASLAGKRGSDGGGIAAVGALWTMMAKALLIGAAIVGSAVILARYRPAKTENTLTGLGKLARPASLMLLAGMSASLPILISPRIHPFYFEPSILFYALAISLACTPATVRLISSAPARLWSLAQWAGMAALLLFVGLLPSKIGKVGRDRDLLHDVRLIGERVCQGRQHCGQTVSVCSEIWQHWELQAYLQRFYHLNLSRDEDRLPFRLDHPDCSPAGAGEYVAQDIGLIHYRLLRRPAL